MWSYCETETDIRKGCVKTNNVTEKLKFETASFETNIILFLIVLNYSDRMLYSVVSW